MKNVVFYGLYLLLNPKLIWHSTIDRLYIPVFLQFQWLRKYNIKTIVDVGAYQGHVFTAIQHLFPSAKVFAFEPSFSNFLKLRHRFSSSNINIVQEALGNKICTVDFYQHDKSYLSSIYQPGDNFHFISSSKNAPKITKAKMNTLDSYFKDKKDIDQIFLKIDTQGSEGLVLLGAKELLNKVSVIHLEIPFVNVYKNDKDFDWIYKYLTKRGFLYMGQAHESDFYPCFNLNVSANCVFVKTTVMPLLKKGNALTKK